MSTSTISLSSSVSKNLSYLQRIQSDMDSTSFRLSTGKKVNSALDDPIAYFSAQNATQRASDLQSCKDSMSQGIETINAADTGIESITDLLKSAKSIANSALSAEDAAELADYITQFNDIMAQIDTMAADSDYDGVNLLNGDTLTITFDETGNSTISIAGFTATSTGLGITAVDAATGWTTSTAIQASITEINDAISTLRTESKTLSSDLNTVQTRQDYTTNLITLLKEGAGNLVNADTNEESVNLTTLETQQQLALTSLSIANSVNQNVLTLFS
ncbi:MAG: flagellin [Syntrophaceae bacterium]